MTYYDLLVDVIVGELYEAWRSDGPWSEDTAKKKAKMILKHVEAFQQLRAQGAIAS